MADAQYLCIACGKSEEKCECDRYCALCYSLYSVRLCEDGQYYCPDCRAVCGYSVQD